MPIVKRSRRVVLPLLNALRSLEPDKRVIILSHLDDVAKDHLYETIAHVIRSDKVPFEKRLFLKKKLGPYKDQLRFITSRKNVKQKSRKLAQIGGGPMTHLLGTAIPLLLNLYSKP